MESELMWRLFMLTGAPEAYLCYRQAAGKERSCTRKQRD